MVVSGAFKGVSRGFQGVSGALMGTEGVSRVSQVIRSTRDRGNDQERQNFHLKKLN